MTLKTGGKCDTDINEYKNHTGSIMNNENTLQCKQKNCLSSSYNNNVLKLCITSLDIISHKKIQQPNIRK